MSRVSWDTPRLTTKLGIDCLRDVAEPAAPQREVFDDVWGGVQEIESLPTVLVERLRHYFATYKLIPGTACTATVAGVYGLDHALRVVEAALSDYRQHFPLP